MNPISMNKQLDIALDIHLYIFQITEMSSNFSSFSHL